MQLDPTLGIYAAALAGTGLTLALLRHRRERRTIERRDDAIEAGLTEPASLHPVIDRGRCLGCGACATACPEGTVLGIIAGKAELIEPTLCIGHGACKAACPFDAISLVFGTEKRGVDLPVVGPDFQTNVSGIYIAGELGGMGLISNAVEQGRQAVDFIVRNRQTSRLPLDLVIVGSGPAGIAASLAAREKKLRYLTLEQDSLGGTVAHFPRGKIVMTRPVHLPIIGKIRLRETSKEALLRLWRGIHERVRLNIRFGERVEAIGRVGDGFAIRTAAADYLSSHVLLAIGRRGTPRKLSVPGEELPKVVYRLIDPEQYKGQSVLIVGGGDSALEAAIAVAGEPGTSVTLAYRGTAINRAKSKNRMAIERLAAERRLEVRLETETRRIESDSVILEQAGQQFAIRNDAVIVCAGGVLPTDFLRSIGVEIETKRGTA
jgi:thioredoxin reductase/Pyruvate/2-oxoacid:ferredoxin oxidoreductase delta subunit